MRILKILFDLIAECIAGFSQGELIVIVAVTTMISIFVVVFLKGKLIQWIIGCYDSLKKNIIFILIFMALICILVQQLELADFITQSHVSLTTDLDKLKEVLVDIFRRK